MLLAKSIIYFLLAGLCEIGGGYLVWLWLREGKSVWYALVGASVLMLYGVIPTLQPANFGRVYATYGGFCAIPALGVAAGQRGPRQIRHHWRCNCSDWCVNYHVLAAGLRRDET
jgi:drug/metabolite transporter superfamily protein YnfA